MGMRAWPLLCLGLLATNLFAGPIQFQEVDLGGGLFRYDYFTNIPFQMNEELDIRFNPALYSNLTNGVANSNFSLLLLQPDNPPGTYGDFSALSLVNSSALSLVFSVTFQYLGVGAPGAQPYYLNLYDDAGRLVATTDSGWTTPVGEVPEPATASLIVGALLLFSAVRAVRRGRVAA